MVVVLTAVNMCEGIKSMFVFMKQGIGPRLRFGALARGIGVVLLCLFAWACSENATGNGKGGEAKRAEAVPVTVSTAAEKTVPVQLRAIGKVQAYNTVAIRAQVAGELVAVHFTEGCEVKKGDRLFTIDPRPFEAEVKKAEANLAKDRAQLENARRQTQRYGEVAKKGFVSQEVHDQVVTNATALEAAVRADEAAVENARLSLKYCYISSPINGVTGETKVDQGNLVKANDETSPLVVINQTSPIYVSFAVPEQNLPDVKKHMAAGKLEVTATVSGNDRDVVKGELSFIDNAVDPTTGTIQLKATFPNTDRFLWPGQYVNAVLTLTTQSGAVVVPSHAIQSGQEGAYAFVVKPDSTVEYRKVTAGRTVDGEIVVEKGIAAGEKVVTDGQLRLGQGSRIRVVEESEAGAEEKGR